MLDQYDDYMTTQRTTFIITDCSDCINEAMGKDYAEQSHLDGYEDLCLDCAIGQAKYDAECERHGV